MAQRTASNAQKEDNSDKSSRQQTAILNPTINAYGQPIGTIVNITAYVA
jgi:hypothetical protein